MCERLVSQWRVFHDKWWYIVGICRSPTATWSPMSSHFFRGIKARCLRRDCIIVSVEWWDLFKQGGWLRLNFISGHYESSILWSRISWIFVPTGHFSRSLRTTLTKVTLWYRLKWKIWSLAYNYITFTLLPFGRSCLLFDFAFCILVSLCSH